MSRNPVTAPDEEHPTFTRRAIVRTAMAFSGLMVLGCSEASGKPAAKAATSAAPKMTTYKDPNCGCCGKWVEAARAAGFDVSVIETTDIMAVKTKVGVPDEVTSCHTTIAGRYIVEGHVPFDAVKRLLKLRPAIKGIGVPGMPAGAPGMEHPSGRAQPFDVLAFDAAGKVSRFG